MARLEGLRPRWTLAFVVGEMVGFIPPAVTGAALWARGAPDAALVAGLTLAGVLEGAAIGTAQAVVLGRYEPGISRRWWITATAAAAAFAWFAGMGGSALIQALPGREALVTALVTPVWLLGLLGMGLAQWLVMRRVVPRSGRWVGVSSAAWLVGVMIPVAALSLAPNEWAPAAHAVIGVGAAVLMGVVVGLITGSTLTGLLARAGTASPGPPSVP